METLIVSGICYVVMFGVKYLAGINLTGNGPDQRVWLRVVLLLLSLLGTIATAALNGTTVDMATLTGTVSTVVAAFVPFLVAHGLYTFLHQN